MPSFNDITGARISSGVHVKGTDKDKFSQGWELLWGKKEINLPLTTCASNRDGKCSHPDCPQLKNYQSGCPLYDWNESDY